MIDYIEQELLRTPMAMPNGDLAIVYGGVPSGTYFTNTLDSYANAVLIKYIQLTFFGRVSPMRVLGMFNLLDATIHKLQATTQSLLKL